MIDLSKQPWQKLYQAAEFAFQKERWLAAERLLREILRQEQTHASAFHLLGKVYLKQARLDAALKAQQRSCELGPSLGWNWFAAGELLMELNRYDEALLSFEQALATLPSEEWIREQIKAARIARFFACTAGEDLREGIGLKTYRYWIQHHESPLPTGSVPLRDDYSCLDPQNQQLKRLRPDCSIDELQTLGAPLGDSPWPTDGWFVLLGDGAQLRPGALQGLERWLIDNQQAQHVCHSETSLCPPANSPLLLPDLLYSDEDCLDAHGQRCDPWLKPGWVADSFWSSPWLTNLSVWRTSWLRDRQLPLPPTDLKGRWSWLLRALELHPRISHIPLVLVHGRTLQLDPEPLKQSLMRQGEAIREIRVHPELCGCFSLEWQLPKKWSCSIIIPTRDRADLLERCLEKVWDTTASARADGCELEILVVDNGSCESETQVLLKRWRERIQVLQSDEPFNWSRLNNKAAAIAKGELLLFLNNDIEAIGQGWFEAMAAQAMRPRVGAVGALLLYPDGTIQHGGVVLGLNHAVDHAYRNLRPNHAVHRGRSRLLSGWGAVTGACLMLRKELLVRVGGLDEGLPVEYNDVDLCLRLTQLGYHCVMPPEAVLMHYECQSRNHKSSQTALPGFNRVRCRWHGQFELKDYWWPAQSEIRFEDGRPIGLGRLWTNGY